MERKAEGSWGDFLPLLSNGYEHERLRYCASDPRMPFLEEQICHFWNPLITIQAIMKIDRRQNLEDKGFHTFPIMLEPLSW